MTDTGAITSAMQQWPTLQNDLGDVLELGMATLDTELVVRGWNRWLEKASGRAASEVVGQPLVDIYPELRGTPVESALRNAAGGTPVVLSQRLHRYLLPFARGDEGSRYRFMQQSARLLPLRDDTQHVASVLLVIEDVTERVSREQELRDATQAAQMASKAKSDFLASMSHELRTPLAAMVGYADLLISEIVGPTTPLQQDHLGRLKACAYHLLGIVEEILTFARAEAGREEIHPEATDAIRLAREAAAVVEVQARAKGLKLTLDLPADAMPLVSDVGKLRQILINLLGNAVKFTDSGSVSLHLRRDDLTHLVFEVSDTGPGIARENLGRIFEPFTQLDQSWARAKGGTGLGLPVSRRLAHLLGGELEVESEPGVGSTFRLSVPLTLPAVLAVSVAEPVAATA